MLPKDSTATGLGLGIDLGFVSIAVYGGRTASVTIDAPAPGATFVTGMGTTVSLTAPDGTYYVDFGGATSGTVVVSEGSGSGTVTAWSADAAATKLFVRLTEGGSVAASQAATVSLGNPEEYFITNSPQLWWQVGRGSTTTENPAGYAQYQDEGSAGAAGDQWAQATEANRPTITAANALVGGKPTIDGDLSVPRTMQGVGAGSFSAPKSLVIVGVPPTVAGDVWIDGESPTHRTSIIRGTGSIYVLNAGVNRASSIAVDSTQGAAVKALYYNDSTPYIEVLKADGTTSHEDLGASTGASDFAGITMFAKSDGTTPSTASTHLVMAFAGDVNAADWARFVSGYLEDQLGWGPFDVVAAGPETDFAAWDASGVCHDPQRGVSLRDLGGGSYSVIELPDLYGHAGEDAVSGSSSTEPSFDSADADYGGRVSVSGNGSSAYMQSSGAPSAFSAPFTILLVGKLGSVAGGSRYHDGINISNRLQIYGDTSMYVRRGEKTAADTGITATTQAAAWIVECGFLGTATATRVRQILADGTDTTSAVIDCGNNAHAGLTLFAQYTQTLFDGGSFTYRAIIPGTISDAEAAAFVADFLVAECGFTAPSAPTTLDPPSTPIVVCEGDSLTATGDNWPTLCTTLAASAQITNTALSGDTAENMNITQDWVPFFHAARDACILCIWAGTNDIWTGATDAEVLAWLWSICDTAQAAGWLVCVCDIIPRGPFDAGQEAYRVALNASIAAGYSGHADAFVQLSVVSELSDPEDTDYFNPDQTHLTAAGKQAVADAIEPTLIGLLPA